MLQVTSRKMKALIRIFINDKEVYPKKMTTSMIETINSQVNTWLMYKGETLIADFTSYSSGVLFGADQKFINEYTNFKIPVRSPSYKIEMEFNFISEDEFVCYCKNIECKGNCGVQPCGCCINICNCKQTWW